MDIQYVKQDITTVDRGVIAHGCNTQGVMGAGVAKFLRNKHPIIFRNYVNKCLKAIEKGTEDSLLGEVDFCIVTTQLIVANCFTQHLGKLIDGRIADPRSIRYSLDNAFAVASLFELPLYMPKIGAGLGGLDWEQDVEPCIKELANHWKNVPIYVCVWP